MELIDSAASMGRAETLGDGARLAALYPSAGANGSLVAVDLLEVQAVSTTPQIQTAEEQILYVLSGSGELHSSDGGPAALVRAGSVIRIAPLEAHTFSATGRDTLRVLVITSLLVLSDRALGVKSTPATSNAPATRTAEHTERPLERSKTAEQTPSQPVERQRPAEQPLPPLERNRVAEPPAAQPSTPAAPIRQPQRTPAPAEDEEEPKPDITGLMRKASELAGQPKPERRRPAPEPEPEPQPEVQSAAAEEEDEAEDKGLMELLVVFHGATRGTPGQGYGAYSVQSPGRRAVVKRAEFGSNYTVNQAEYESLIQSLQYIVARLTATNRTADQVGLEIKTDSDLLVNQLQGIFKVKDAGLKTKHNQAVQMLEEFGAWQIEWQSTEDTLKQLGG